MRPQGLLQDNNKQVFEWQKNLLLLIGLLEGKKKHFKAEAELLRISGVFGKYHRDRV